MPLPPQLSPRPSWESKYAFIISSNIKDLLLQDSNSQLVKVQRLRDCGFLIPKWDISISPSLLRLRDYWVREERRNYNQRWWVILRRLFSGDNGLAVADMRARTRHSKVQAQKHPSMEMGGEQEVSPPAAEILATEIFWKRTSWFGSFTMPCGCLPPTMEYTAAQTELDRTQKQN